MRETCRAALMAGVRLLSSVDDIIKPEVIAMNYKVVLQKSEEGYSVSCPGLPGCWSQGETEREALVNIQDAISEYLAVVNESVIDLEVHEDLKQNI